MTLQPATTDLAEGPPALSLGTAAAVQDDLLTVLADLERLQSLIARASNTLTTHFVQAWEQLAARACAQAGATPCPSSVRALDELKAMVGAMQVHDMAEQLISHTRLQLRGCGDRLAAAAMGEDDTTVIETPPLPPSPVGRDESRSGSVDLF
jgi:hypothetical protein